MLGDKMGLISGSGSLTRYWVDGDLPGEFMEELPKKIGRYAFKNIDENSFEEQSMGWVNIIDILDNRFIAMEYLKEPYIAMSLRVDKRNVPKTALKQYCREAEEKIKELEHLEFLPKEVRRNIKEDARNRLLKRAIPVSNIYDMIWDINRGIVIFGAVNNKLCDEFAGFFLKSFDFQLQPVFPYALACRLLDKDETSTDLNELLPSGFSGGTGMQVSEKVKETESLGREFMIWLWFRTETDKEFFDLGDAGEAEIRFDGKMTLQRKPDQGTGAITFTGDHDHMKEARFVLSEKKEITQALLKLTIGDNQWSFVLDSSWMNLKTFKTPRVMQDKEDDPDGIFYEKMYLIEEALNAIDVIFSYFMKLRISPEWEAEERPALVKWIQSAKDNFTIDEDKH